MLNYENISKIYYHFKDNKIIKIRSLKNLNLNYYDINKLIKSGKLVRLTRGKYQITKLFSNEYINEENIIYNKIIGCIFNKDYNNFIRYYKFLKNCPNYSKKINLYLYLINYLFDKKEIINNKIKLKQIDDGSLSKNIFTDILNNNFFNAIHNFYLLNEEQSIHLKTIGFLLKEICDKQNKKNNNILSFIKNEQYDKLNKYFKTFNMTHEEKIIHNLCLILYSFKTSKKIYTAKSCANNLYDAIYSRDFKTALYYSNKYCFEKNISCNDNPINILLKRINNIYYNEIHPFVGSNILSIDIQNIINTLNEKNNTCIIEINNNKNQVEEILLKKKMISFISNEKYFYVKYNNKEIRNVKSEQKIELINKIKILYNNEKYEECIELCNFLIINSNKFYFNVYYILANSYKKIGNISMYEKLIAVCYCLDKSFKDTINQTQTINFDIIIHKILYEGMNFEEAFIKYKLDKESLLILKLYIIKKLYLYNYYLLADKIFKSVLKEQEKSKQVKFLINEINQQKKLIKLKKINSTKSLNINLKY